MKQMSQNSALHYYIASICSRYNARSDWLILGNYFPVMPTGRTGLNTKAKRPYNKQLINLKSSVFMRKSQISTSPY